MRGFQKPKPCSPSDAHRSCVTARGALLLLSLCAALFLGPIACMQTHASRVSDPAGGGIEKDYESGPARVRLSIDRVSITIAEDLRLTLETEAPEDYEVRFPGLKDKLGEFGIVDLHQDTPRLAGEGLILIRQEVLLEPFLSGEYRIPPMTIVFRPKTTERPADGFDGKIRIETGELIVQVRSVLSGDGEKAQINPAFGPMELPGRSFSWTLINVGLAALAVSGLAAFLLHRRRKRLMLHDAPALSAHDLAYGQVQAIIEEGLLDRGEVKLFYTRLSDVVRTYIENRFGWHAPKLTSEELLAGMGVDFSLSRKHRSLLDEFLSHCDLVKFAEYQPSIDEAHNTLDACKAFIAGTAEGQGEGRERGHANPATPT